MMRWLLERLAQNPSAQFSNHELAIRGGAELQRYQEEGLLRGVPFPELPTIAVIHGRRLLISERAGQIEGQDEDEPEAPPVTLQTDDLRRWRVDKSRVCEALRRINHLIGTVRELDRHFWYLGEASHEGPSSAVVLSLLSGPAAASWLRGLPVLLPAPSARTLVLSTSYEPTPLERLQLASQGIFPIFLGDDGRFEWPADPPHTAVSPVRLAVRVTGERVPRGKSYIVAIAGVPVPVTETPFLRFLRLIVAGSEEQNGFLDGDEFLAAAHTRADSDSSSVHQAVYRLRRPLASHLNVSPDDFIEVRQGQVRVGVEHVDLTWDRERLLRLGGAIAAIAARLPIGGRLRSND